MRYKFFTISNSPSKKLVDLLKKNIIGTPRHGMLYQHLEVQKKIDFIVDPYYVNLNKGDDIVGTCCFCSRDTLNAGKIINSFYLRYVTFKTIYRIKSKPDSRSQQKKSTLRKEIVELLAGDGLGERAKDSFLHYAYVDPENYRSALLCKEFGFESVRQFSTIIFHRMRPKETVQIDKISPSQVPEMMGKLTSFYKEYTMFSFENLFRLSDYYVVRNKEGTIIAGAQATPDHWKVLELPGISGKIILALFSSLPMLNKLIRKDYRFITLEGIYVLPGNEDCLEHLFESLLARYNRNAAMLWLDKDSGLYKTVCSLKLGVLEKLNKEVRANVICKFNNIPASDQDIFRNNPAYISGIDLT